MPFTPFHMGPGAAIKAVTGRYFSLLVFGFSQVLIDIEPLVRIIRGETELHGFTHTYIGAIPIGLLSVVVGKFLCEWGLKCWNTIFKSKYVSWLRTNTKISWLAAASGGMIGTLSHVFLDSIMHSDMHPLSPFSSSNGMLNLMPVGWLYMLCSVLGAIGLILLFILWLWDKWAIEIK